jgi:hypothetical protein
MEFERFKDPIKSMDIGWERKLKKGDKFTLIVPAIKDNPERMEIATAIEEESSHKIHYVEKRGSYGQPAEMDWYEIRQVRWEIPEIASGVAEMTENCEHPRWIFTTNPLI